MHPVRRSGGRRTAQSHESSQSSEEKGQKSGQKEGAKTKKGRKRGQTGRRGRKNAKREGPDRACPPRVGKTAPFGLREALREPVHGRLGPQNARRGADGVLRSRREGRIAPIDDHDAAATRKIAHGVAVFSGVGARQLPASRVHQHQLRAIAADGLFTQDSGVGEVQGLPLALRQPRGNQEERSNRTMEPV